MKTALLVVVAALVVASVAARCPNSCSGHGNCGRDDKCTCWANWQGNDCSLRTCGYDNAWAMNKYNPHFYAECSNKGICDRATGLCDCFDQYEGRACTRSSCPNGCSGHGKCRYINEQSNSATYYGWDAEKIQVCVCDGGFYGPDCSQRYCPMGDDPLTICDDSLSSASSDYDIHRVTVWFPMYTGNKLGDGMRHPAGANLDDMVVDHDTDEFILKFTDPHGEVWTTQRIEDVFSLAGRDNATASSYAISYVDAADRVRDALKALPNHVIPDLNVQPSTPDSEIHQYLRSWDVSFTSPRNSGEQNDLQCFVTGCQNAGCQPMYKQLRYVNRGTFSTDWTAEITPTAAEGVVLTSDTVFDATSGHNTSNFYNYDYKVYVQVFNNNSLGETDGRADDDISEQGYNYRSFIAKYGDSTQDWNQADLLAGEDYGTAAKRVAHFHAHWTLNFEKNLDGTKADHSYYKRIPVETDRVSVGHGAFVKFGSRRPTAGHYMWLVSLAQCSVDGNPSDLNDVHPNRENVECSNRGECDAATGLCACHEGYYGDNCQSQTILV